MIDERRCLCHQAWLSAHQSFEMGVEVKAVTHLILSKAKECCAVNHIPQAHVSQQTKGCVVHGKKALKQPQCVHLQRASEIPISNGMVSVFSLSLA